MKFFEKTHTYEYDWETATSAWWDKYPNPDQPQVKHWDTLHKDINDSTGKLLVHRLFWIEYGLPKWTKSVLRTSSMDGYGLEKIVCDVDKKELVMHGRNFTFRNVIEIEETCTYREHPDNPKWTQFVHRSEFRVGKLGVLSAKLEESARDSAYGKSNIGVDVMEKLIHKLNTSEWKKNVEDLSKEQLEKGKQMYKQVEKGAVEFYEKVRSKESSPPPK